MSRKALFVGATASGAAAVALVAGWLLFLRDRAEPVAVGDAVTSFREETETAPSGPSPVPAGVYVYDTAGFERTDALTGVTHRYPRRSTITVTADPCGARLRWDVLRGRSTTWTFCVRAGGWWLASQDERHTFFGRTERTTYVCENTPLRPAGDPVGARWPVACGTGTAEERGRASVVGRERLRVGGRLVATVHVRKVTSFTGAIRGETTHDLWLARETGVPVRLVMVSRTTNDSAVGDVHYEEEVSLQLLTLVPRR
ncbi:MAG TPA: hypothetical protein VNK94_12870 [Gaiellaceae bacterium]|nr:hypothetical protein [Gaiellaceae bacterium]